VAYGGVDVLRRGLEVYENMEKEFLEKYRGRVVVIKDGELVGVYGSVEDVFRDIAERCGLVPVLIERVTEEKLLTFPSTYRTCTPCNRCLFLEPMRGLPTHRNSRGTENKGLPQAFNPVDV